MLRSLVGSEMCIRDRSTGGKVSLGGTVWLLVAVNGLMSCAQQLPPPIGPVEVAVVEVAVVGSVGVGGSGTPGGVVGAGIGTETASSPTTTAAPETTLYNPASSTSPASTTRSPAAPNFEDSANNDTSIAIGAVIGAVLLVVVLIGIGYYFVKMRHVAQLSKGLGSEACLEMIPHNEPVTSSQKWNTHNDDDINAVEL
eukprot:TRINITY_DN50532_c0_g1_i1.p1 TRINITY_DN50532_c0_g1~~TRINITY_DN50532_c0_g1_i1.p1  ORF type:complete len:198 (-),score=28.75 TRINITY_DN50532_c0_g1_i1:174-767(-)